MRYQIKDLGVEVDGDSLLTDRNNDCRSGFERIGDYGRAIAEKKREMALTAMLGAAATAGIAGCCGNSAAKKLKSYGRPIKETAPIISEDGTRDFWRLARDKDGYYHWVHYIDRPGKRDDISAYRYSGEPPEEPPKLFDEIISEIFGNLHIAGGL